MQEETARIQSVLISEATKNDGRPSGTNSLSATKKIASEFLKAMDSRQRLYFVGSLESFERLTKQLSDSRLQHIPSEPYMWLQDLVEFGNDHEGLAAFVSYGNLLMRQTVEEIMKVVSPHSPNRIKILSSSAVHGTTGGNLERWPGAVGVIGTSDFESEESTERFARQIFPKETLLKIPTSWLEIGHVDEVLKILRYRPGPNCEVEFLVNSPAKALSLLKRNSSEYFLSELEFGSTRFQEISSIRNICDLGNFRCSEFKNRDVAELFARDLNLSTWIERVRSIQNDTIQLVNEVYAERMPQCSVTWIEVPALYLPPLEGHKIGSRKGRSIFPSLTNGVFLNDTYLVADPGNNAFREEVKLVLESRGIKVRFVPLGREIFKGDSFDGHLHCMTQVIRVD